MGRLNSKKNSANDNVSYKHMLEFSSDGIYKYDFVTGEMIFANPGTMRILELDGEPEGIIGKKLKDLLIYVDSEGSIRKRVKERGEIHNYEYHFKTLKGNDRWVIHDSFLSQDECSGRTIVEVMVKDITDMKIYQKQIEVERRQFANYLDVSGIVIVALDRNGKIEILNKRACEVLGVSPEEFKGKDWFSNFIPERNIPSVRNSFNNIIGGHISHLAEYENPVKTSSGNERIVAWRNSLIRDADGNITGTLSAGRDITEKIENEKKLLHINNVLRSVRYIDHLIVQEKDIEKLADKACHILTRIRGYSSAGIVLYDREDRPLYDAYSSLEKDNSYGKSLNMDLAHMSRELMSGPDVRVVTAEDIESPSEDRSSTCAIVSRLSHKGKFYGILHVCVPGGIYPEDDEVSIFKEIADDISLAVNDIVLEKEEDKKSRLLEKAKVKYEALINTAPNIVMVLDQENKVTEWNLEAESIFGANKENVSGSDFVDLFVPELEKQKNRQMFDSVREGKTVRYFENNVETRKKGVRTILWNMSATTDVEETKTGILAIGQDVSDRKWTEESLKKSMEGVEELESIVNRSPAIVFLRHNNKDWPVQYISENIKQFGYAVGDFISGESSWWDIIHDEDRARIEDLINLHKTEGTDNFVQNYRIITKEGEERWVEERTKAITDPSGKISHYQGIVIDITERKIAEEQLSQVNRALKAVSAFNEAMVRTDNEIELLENACSVLNSECGYENVWIGFLDEKKKVKTVCEKNRWKISLVSLVAEAMEKGDNPVNNVMEKGASCIVQDITSVPFLYKRLGEIGYKSFGAFPIKWKDSVIGAIVILSGSENMLMGKELVLLGELVDDVNYGLAMCRSREEHDKTEKDLRKSEEMFRLTFENANDAIAWADIATGKIINCNKKAEDITGLTREELIGAEYTILYPVNEQTKYSKIFDKHIKSGGMQSEYGEIVSKTGSRTPVTITSSVTDIGGRSIIQCIFHDITMRKRSENDLKVLNKELIKTNRRLEQLSLKDSHTSLYNHRYLNEIIESEFNRAKRYGQPISVMMMDIDYFKSINDVYGHMFGDKVLKNFSKHLKKMVRGYDTLVRFGGEEFIILSPELDRMASLTMARRILDSVNIKNFGDKKNIIKIKLSVGVYSYPEDRAFRGMSLVDGADKVLNKAKESGGNRVYSTLDTGNRKEMNDEDQRTDMKFLTNKINKLTMRSNQSLIESVFALARTIELKDRYTGEHVERTVHYATDLARGLKLPEPEIERIRQAAVLHDLGKIGISDSILGKAGKLDKKEFEEIKRHPSIGADILRPIQFLHDIIPYIYHHHERWDGTGYPDGLAGEEIPLGARIIAVADVYQALISDRSYRKALDRKEVINVLKDGAGKQFDPRITEVFLKIIKKRP